MSTENQGYPVLTYYSVYFSPAKFFNPPFLARSIEEAKISVVRSIENEAKSGNLTPSMFTENYLAEIGTFDTSNGSFESFKMRSLIPFTGIWEEFHLLKPGQTSDVVLDSINSVSDIAASAFESALKASESSESSEEV